MTSIEETLRAIIREELQRALRELHPADQAPASDRYLPVPEAASIAAVHADTMRAWLKAGRLPAHHAGRELRVRLSDLERFMASGGTNGGERPTIDEEAAQALARIRR